MEIVEGSHFRESMLHKVIELETNDGRFESFCQSVISIIEGGAVVLPTSRSWDLGRDGVGAGPAAGVFVCCSLRDDVDLKALTDIERLIATTPDLGFIYFCSSQNLSEYRINQIETELRTALEFKTPVKCLGSLQLASVANREAVVAEKHYGSELSDCYAAISNSVSDDTESVGLRLALMSAAGESSQDIRDELYASGLLDLISEKSSTIGNLARRLSEELKLSRPLPQEVIIPHLKRLVTQEHINQIGGIYSITEAGRNYISEREVSAAGRLLVGRNSIRNSLEVQLGTKILDDHFSKIWKVFEDRMAHYFSSRGHSIVLEISALLSIDGEPAGTEALSGYSFLDELARQVSETSSHAQQRDELYLAVKDIFTDRSGVATEWLVKLAASFIAACALGLEYSCGAALSKLFARTNLIVDTDVLLSLMCVGEPEHEAVVSIVTRWIKNNGKVLVGQPVLEEAAYHAFIAQKDYEQVSHLIPGQHNDRIHIIENAFVRAFAELVADKKANRNQWTPFISQFRGSGNREWSKIFGHVSAEYSIEKLPPRSSSEESLERTVRQYLIRQAEAKIINGSLHNARDKASRDAQLYAALVHHLKSLRSVDPGATCLLVSSARRLIGAEAQFHQSGEPQLVVSISAILYLLAMIPNVSLGLGAMKVFLFDERRSGFSSELERTLLRLIRSSQEVSMPFAKRGLLMRSVRERMLKDAGKPARAENPALVKEVELNALKPENQKRTLQILKESLDEMAIDTRAEKENRELKARIVALEQMLEAAKSRK